MGIKKTKIFSLLVIMILKYFLVYNRYLYDEDSPKGYQLSAEIEQLEASEPGSPQVKSPSRELSTTLRNLKRLETMLKGKIYIL